MTELQVDVWLRGTDFARTQVISGIALDPSAWTDRDVSKLLKAMLLAIHRAKNPDSTDTPVFLRGFSWIVNPYEEGGVVVAIEIQAGAAVAGPFNIDKKQLEDMVSRAIAQQASPASPGVVIH
ncbi:MAG TPA: hypothetical protein VGZ27_15340 [Vicinamibacterales bacterium]|jgi:hypothetical protein|nr:hypothetical protein [Vicinamibacterales bacterium]